MQERPFKRWGRRAGTVGLIGALCASLLMWTAEWFWLGEVAVSFAWHLGLATGVGAVLLLAVGSWRSAILAGLLAVFHAGPELSLYLSGNFLLYPSMTPEKEKAHQAPSLTVANCNLLWDNHHYEAFRAWLARNAPEVVVCQEVSPGWRGLLTRLPRYPHVLLSPRPKTWTPHTWGTAILSRRPFVSTRLIPPPSGIARPLMEAEVRCGAYTVVVRGVHTMRAGRPHRLRQRDAVLSHLGAMTWGEHTLLAGDLNLVSTSPMWTRLLARTGLRDSRPGFGRQPTWTTDRLIPGLSIAIDHILVGSRLRVLDRHISTIPGSDHRAVWVHLAVMDPAGTGR